MAAGSQSASALAIQQVRTSSLVSSWASFSIDSIRRAISAATVGSWFVRSGSPRSRGRSPGASGFHSAQSNGLPSGRDFLFSGSVILSAASRQALSPALSSARVRYQRSVAEMARFFFQYA